jgi:hypothetical protein
MLWLTLLLCFVSPCLQPHGRDEHLITAKMWKHILIQGLYQMFWLFFFMYAAPVLFERYRITDHCTFATQGPHETMPDPMFCTNELVSKLGFQVRALMAAPIACACGCAVLATAGIAHTSFRICHWGKGARGAGELLLLVYCEANADLSLSSLLWPTHCCCTLCCAGQPRVCALQRHDLLRLVAEMWRRQSLLHI